MEINDKRDMDLECICRGYGTNDNMMIDGYLKQCKTSNKLAGTGSKSSNHPTRASDLKRISIAYRLESIH